MNYYDMLGVPRDASPGEIGHAYRAKQMQLSDERYDGAPPDLMKGVTQPRSMLDEAEKTLGDPAGRADYDERLDHATDSAVPAAAPARGGLGDDHLGSPDEWYRSPLADALEPLQELANWLGPDGRGSKTVIVPDVRGMKASEAFYEVAKADLQMKFVRLTENPAGVDGTCIDQDPAPGSSARRHSTVTVQVWHPTAGSESAPIRVPRLSTRVSSTRDVAVDRSAGLSRARKQRESATAR